MRRTRSPRKYKLAPRETSSLLLIGKQRDRLRGASRIGAARCSTPVAPTARTEQPELSTFPFAPRGDRRHNDAAGAALTRPSEPAPRLKSIFFRRLRLVHRMLLPGHMKFIRRQLLLGTCLLLSTALVFGQNSKIAPDLLNQLDNSGSVNVVVQYTPGSSSGGGLLGLLDNLLGGLLNLVSSLGGVVTQQYSSVPALAATMPVSQLTTLANNSSVAYISPDRPVARHARSDPPLLLALISPIRPGTRVRASASPLSTAESTITPTWRHGSYTARALSRPQTWTITATARTSPASSPAAALPPPARNSRALSAASRPARI